MATDVISIRARTVAVVGAGPSGLIAAKYLRAEKVFDKIVLFEQRSKSGGIWNYTRDQRDEDLFDVPQTSPRGKNQNPVWRASNSPSNPTAELKDGEVKGVQKEASFLSPIYDRLETNIPRGLMGFQDLDWPEDSQLFPKHETVLEYIQEYGQDVQDFIQYETQVTNIEPIDDQITGGWKVRTRNLRTTTEQEEDYDAAIVANGHFIVPYIPDIPGIKEWNATFPGSISHAKYYRTPEEFKDKKVIVVGNSASGTDISTQISHYASSPLLWSSKSPSQFIPSPSPVKRSLPPISTFLPQTRTVEFEDGTRETHIDAIVFATGYFYSLPFLENVVPKVIHDGSHVHHTYQHLFYAPRPTLSFLALPQRVIPFPLAEAQAAVLARVYAGRLSLPPLRTMRSWEESVVRDMGDGRNFHLLPFPKDGEYINEMARWALSASLREGLENGGKGKVPPVWGEWEFWCRERFPKIRAAFAALGEGRHNVLTLGEVGFWFEERSDREVDRG